MTSKEALERLKTHIVLLEERVEIDNTSVNPYAVDYKTVKKDLEVLEILKKHFYEEYKIASGPYSLLFRLNGTNEYEKIKEWLSNDK